MDNFAKHPVIVWKNHTEKTEDMDIIMEEPLSIRVQGNPYSVVLRTPGDEIPHVAGFCLGEGIADNPDDIGSIAFCDGADTNVVTVSLSRERREMATKHLERRGYISQSSCGLCGKEMVEDLEQEIPPLTDNVIINSKEALNLLENLSRHQPLRQKTRAAHGAAIYDAGFNILSSAEDVGRHNALDKAIGKLFLNKTLQKAALLTLSSRISYELVQKAARARIPVLMAMSRPTTLAVNLAKSLNITLACLVRGGGLFIFCGEKRLKR